MAVGILSNFYQHLIHVFINLFYTTGAVTSDLSSLVIAFSVTFTLIKVSFSLLKCQSVHQYNHNGKFIINNLDEQQNCPINFKLDVW